MAIEFSCECGRQIKVRDEYAGSPIKCPGCRSSVQVPKPGTGESPQVARATTRGPSTPQDPSYYGFAVGFAGLCLVLSVLGFVMITIAHLSSESPSAPSLMLVIASGFGMLSSLWMLALSLIVVEVGRKVRRG
ncbi:hypothetical protein [Singulisphaera sp. PoT]|uniref:hypothetical protein n=1 Tax=Singulisphaera sp. PoT TaxID=3411797 RepID=UPI003BF61602